MQVVNRVCHQIAEAVPGFKFEQRPVWRTTFPSGGSIQMRSAENPDSLRGATLDYVVFDEAATARPEAWPTLRPTLSVREGGAMFISTPKGLNWYYDLFEDAAGYDDWDRWRFPSVSNPYLPPEDVAKAREQMSSLVFSQEYEAEFISHGSGMFHADWIQQFDERFVGGERFYVLGDESVAEASCWKFHTVDLAWSMEERADFTVISTWAVTPRNHLLLIDVVRGHFEGPDIVPRLQAAWKQHGGGYLAVEKATRQMSIIQEAERTGLPIRVVRAEKDKVARALPATARMERHTVWFKRRALAPWFTDVEQELLAFPAGRHDDFVDTLSYACIQLANSSAYEDRGPIVV